MPSRECKVRLPTNSVFCTGALAQDDEMDRTVPVDIVQSHRSVFHSVMTPDTRTV